MNDQKIKWITRTGALTALLIALQWVTAGTSAFAGQYITGSCVNCVLAVAALLAGPWSAVVVAVASPFFAFFLGIGPKLLPIVPMISLGNTCFVLLLCFLAGKNAPLWRQALGLLVSAAAKALALYVGVVKLLIPVLGDTLKGPQIQTFTAMFSYPQLITALIGGAVALIILPLLKKALKEA